MARKGADHRRILSHYYRETVLGRAPTDRTRVLLLAGVPSVEVTGATRIPGQRSLNPDRTYCATATPVGEVELRRASGRLVGRYRVPLALDARGERVRLGGGSTACSGGQYRGTLLLIRTRAGCRS